MISFRHLKKSFGAREVLKDITFDVPEGQILFILGVSGTGKSVLLKTLVGLLKPTSGEIFVGDREISRLTEKQLFAVRKTCGMVFQQPALFDSLNVFENVAYGVRKHHPEYGRADLRERVTECLNLVHLSGIEQKFPQDLSYGMQKRVSLARSIAVRPRILLFDEPTTGLDPVTTSAINALIQELSRVLKTTSLVVSHDIRCALEIADQILFLDQGQVVARGTPAELKTNPHPLVQDFLREALDVHASS